VALFWYRDGCQTNNTKTKEILIQFTSLTNEDSTIILLGLYDIVFDFHRALLRKLPPSLPAPDQAHPPTKKTRLPLVMLVCLMLFKFFVGHRSWKEYYRYLKSHHHGVNVGYLPSYRNFMVSMHKLAGYGLVFLEAVRKYCKQGIELQFADASALPVCKVKREFAHKVARGIAAKSKGTMGWYYGFKLHLVCDVQGQILAWRITTATVDDRKGLALIWHELTGMIVADAGYLGSNWQEAAAELHLTLLTGVKKIMKRLMTKWQYFLLKARQRVETTFSVVKFRLGMDTTLPRSVNGYFVHYVWCLLAYQLRRMGQLEQQTKQAALAGC
jgi:transposase